MTKDHRHEGGTGGASAFSRATRLTRLLLGLGFVLGCALQPQSATPAEATQARLERLAGIYSHFSLEVIIYNRELRL